MSDIVFVKTRHEYQSYSDLWKLVDLSGFGTCYIDEVDPADASKCYILPILNGEVTGWKKKPKASIYVYDLEWRLDGNYPKIPGVKGFWAGDSWYAHEINAVYVPMGSHPDLRDPLPIGRAMPNYDVAFLAYLTHRRSFIRDRLISANVNVSPSSAWGEERAAILHYSRLYLNVHQRDDAPTIAPLRMIVAAAYKLPVVSENVNDQGVFYGQIVTEPFDKLVERLPEWIRYERLSEYGEALFQQLCIDWTFRKAIEANV